MSEAASSSCVSDAAKRLEEQKARLRSLHTRRNESRKQNHQEVVEEDRRDKLPKNYEAKRQRQEWELEELEKRKEAEEKGQDYDRLKNMQTQADIAEKIDGSKRRKKNPDTGFADYEAMTMRQYQRLTTSLKPDMRNYSEMRQVMGDEQFYPSSNTLIQGNHYPTDSSIDRLVGDIEKQATKRDQYHRRRMFDPEANIDYINERNRKFNQKLDRFYNQYTEDVKQDLERGTAV
uniref:Pre-mRNA-splicing factor SYF2 n=1 Tax=Plectus sambesii TaxID=2011161 RepID=A0A914VIN4_9BILA